MTLKSHVMAIVTQDLELFRRLEKIAKGQGVPVIQLSYADRVDYVAHWAEDADLILMVDANDRMSLCLEWIHKIAIAHPNTISLWIQEDFDQNCVVQAIRSGARDLLIGKFTDDDVRELLVRAGHAFMETRSPSVVIGMMGAGGGVGVSTLLANTAVEIARMRDESVGVIELSQRKGGVALQLNLNPTQTLHDVADRTTDLDITLLRKLAVQHSSGVSLLTAQGWPTHALPISTTLARTAIQRMQEACTYVLVDVPNDLGPLTQVAMEQLDALVLVVPTTLAGATCGSQLFECVGHLDYPPRKLGWIANSLSDPAQLSLPQLRRVMSREPLGVIPCAVGPVAKAVAQGEPISSVAPRTLVAKRLRALAQRLLEHYHHTNGQANTVPARLGMTT